MCPVSGLDFDQVNRGEGNPDEIVREPANPDAIGCVSDASPLQCAGPGGRLTACRVVRSSSFAECAFVRKPELERRKRKSMAVKNQNSKSKSKSSNEGPQTLNNALGQIEKVFGKGSIMKLSANENNCVPGISTGALSLDIALGGQGFPKGRIIELFGPESSGKTTLALHAIASAQQEGGIAAFIDAEHALDPSWAKRLGVNLEDLLVSQPSYGEEALQIAEMLVKSNAVDLIVVDSVAALVPKAELDGEIGDTHVGLQARMMSQAMRKLTGAISRSKTTVIFINQIREKIGVMFGSPETTPGGRALKFYSSCRVDVRRMATLKDGDVATGIRMKAKVVKNKVAPPFRVAEFDMLGVRGISKEADILDLAVDDKLVSRSGSWFSYKETRMGQGKERAREFLEENPEVYAELKRLILESRGFLKPQSVEPEAEAVAAE